ncbi:putative bifunctional diguanylate cyclase/phosphodiesterase [Actinosynnema mirum]|uniref:putative bifunctional diguanylate cyclase/phosphodiesterase n=1 Tax=Actinosynnema mirum TaxID=40567 RepID=UPI00117F73B0|nr:EAL domain-containing protein [Actinosynnema mirum]
MKRPPVPVAADVPPASGSAHGTGRRTLHRIRVLTTVFAWLGGVLTIGSLVATGEGPLPIGVAALVAGVLACWLRVPRDAWWIPPLEGVVAFAALLLLPDPQVVVGFVIGATVRRALYPEDAGFWAKSAVVVGGYLTGLAASLLWGWGAIRPELLPTLLMPLAGMAVAAAALHEAARAVLRAESAQRGAEHARATATAVLQASPIGLVLLDSGGVPVLHNERAQFLLDWAGQNGAAVPCPHGPNIAVCEKGCRDADAEPVEVWVADRDRVLALHPVRVEQAGDEDRTLVAAVDISVRRRLEDELRHRSERDVLTGLTSRSHFLHLLDRALRAGDVGLLVLDLDQFKEVNDTEGHDAGDQCLVAASRRIRAAVEPDAVAARLGGDEFAVLAPGLDEQACGQLAKSVLAELEKPWSDLGYDVRMQASIGVAVSSAAAGVVGTAELLRDADTAMYVAKREGGARARSFRREMGEQALARQRDKLDLRAAIGTDQLVLHYQPIVDLATTAISGAEALVRWERPGRGLLGPGEFIGLAEQTGLIVPLGSSVLTSACTQAAGWRAAGRELGVTVNVSTRQLSAPGFLAALAKSLDVSGLQASALTIEVTESVWADEAAMRALMAVRETGVRVALDDFGTGYSSLSYLHRYPFDVVKIDKSFTWALGDTGRTAGVVRCIIDLADVLGAVTVAEGIETPEQAEWLRRAGCGFGQGFLFGRPDLPRNLALPQVGR